jgi:hypothetical protein
MRLFLLTIFFISSVVVFAQNDSTKIDISQIVREQIELAQAKQELETITKKEEQKTAEVTRQPYVIRRIKKETTGSSGNTWKVLILIGASATIFGYVYIRRKYSTVKNTDKKKLKRNIQSIREERVMRKDNPYLKQIRFNLVDSTGKGELSEEAITNAARKLRISREEIMLANRIQSFKMMNA